MAKKRRRKGPVSEAKREQGRRLAERMKRENGRFVGLEPEPAGEAVRQDGPEPQAPARPEPRKRAPRAGIETLDQELVANMHGHSSTKDESLLAKRQRRQERRLGG